MNHERNNQQIKEFNNMTLINGKTHLQHKHIQDRERISFWPSGQNHMFSDEKGHEFRIQIDEIFYNNTSLKRVLIGLISNTLIQENRQGRKKYAEN